jgi:hypothetical protein
VRTYIKRLTANAQICNQQVKCFFFLLAVLVSSLFTINAQTKALKQKTTYTVTYKLPIFDSTSSNAKIKLELDTVIEEYDQQGHRIYTDITPHEVHVELLSYPHLDSIVRHKISKYESTTTKFWSNGTVERFYSYKHGDSVCKKTWNNGRQRLNWYSESFSNKGCKKFTLYKDSSAKEVTMTRLTQTLKKTWFTKVDMQVTQYNYLVDTINIVFDRLQKVKHFKKFVPVNNEWHEFHTSKERFRKTVSYEKEFDDQSATIINKKTVSKYNKDKSLKYEVVYILIDGKYVKSTKQRFKYTYY